MEQLIQQYATEGILYYFIAGLIYVLINAYRRLDTEGDYMLVLVWIFAWPLFVLMHIGKSIFNKIKRLL